MNRNRLVGAWDDLGDRRIRAGERITGIELEVPLRFSQQLLRRNAHRAAAPRPQHRRSRHHLNELIVQRASPLNLLVYPLEVQVGRRPADSCGDQQHSSHRPPAAQLAAALERCPARDRKGREHNQADRRHQHIAPNVCQAAAGDHQIREPGRRNHDRGQYQLLAALLNCRNNTKCGDDRNRQLQHRVGPVERVVGERVERAAAAQRFRCAAGHRHREERVAGDDEVDHEPDHRSNRGVAKGTNTPPPAERVTDPKRVKPRQEPGLRAKQAGHREQHPDRPAAASGARLEYRCPADQRSVRRIEKADPGHVGNLKPSYEQPERDKATKNAGSHRAKAVDGDHQRDVADQRPGDHQRCAVVAGWLNKKANCQQQRVLGRHSVGLEVRQPPLPNIA